MGVVLKKVRRADLDLLERHRIEQARRSFWAFRQYMHPGLVKGWWARLMAAVLQQFYLDLINGRRPKLVVEAPPQHGKSTTIVDFIAWVLGHNPDLRTIFASFSDRLGVRANLALQRMIGSAKYRKVFPDTLINLPGAGYDGNYTTNRKLIEMVGRIGSFRNTTVNGAINGESLDLGVIDDPVKGRKEARSQHQRDTVWDWFSDDFTTRFSEYAGLLVIMTRWHRDDLVGRIRAQDPDVKVFSYPALAKQEEEHRKKGEALFPELKSREFLESKKRFMLESSWEAVYQQDPVASEGKIFKPENIRFIDSAPAETVWVRAWDFASSEDRTSDYTAGGKLGYIPSTKRFVIGHVTRIQGAPEEVEALVVSTAKADNHDVRISIPQDPGQAGKAQVAYYVKKLAGFTVSTSPESGDKQLRAEPFASQVNAGNVDMIRGDWNLPVIDELRIFGSDTGNDDQVDCLSRAFMEHDVNEFGMLDYYRQLVEDQKKARKV